MMASEQEWRPSPRDLALPDNAVHVWRASLDRPDAALQRLWQTLSDDERSRADRFHFTRDRTHFIVARGVLRAILGGYLQIAPDRLRFRYSHYGKPTLAPEAGQATLDFNVSHSHGLALYAVTRGRAIGIDVERVRPDFAGDGIAERFFSAAENMTLRDLPQHMRLEAFFACWTRKEAYIKARGEGLSLPLDQFDVSITPGEPARLLATWPDPAEAARWSLRELAPGAGYIGALAVEGTAGSCIVGTPLDDRHCRRLDAIRTVA